MNWRTSRRKLLATTGAAAALVASGIKLFTPATDSTAFGQGELWNGFLILGLDEPVPPGLDCLNCDFPPVNEGPGATEASETALASASALAAQSPIRIYEFSPLPGGLQPTGARLSVSPSGRVAWARATYGPGQVGDDGVQRLSISVGGTQMFLHPYPVRATRVRDAAPIQPEKTTVLGRPALITRTTGGDVVHWIDGGVLYQMFVDVPDADGLVMDLISRLHAAAG